MVTGINTGYYGLNNFNYNNQYGTSPYLISNSGITPAVFAPTTVDPKKTAEADDGKISFGSKVKNFFKGVGKFFTGMFTDENGKFSLGKTLKTAAIAVGIGAVCVLTAGTAVPALIAAGGVVASGVGVAKGAYRAATATTDAEAEAAWQSIGSSTTALGLSVVGAKAVAKGAGANVSNGVKGYADGVKYVFQESGSAIKNSAVGVKDAWQGAAGETVLGKLDAVKTNVVEQGKVFGDKVKANYEGATTGIKNKVAKESESLEAKQAKYQDKANAAKSEKVKNFYEEQAKKVQQEIAARNEMNGAKNYQEGQEILSARDAEITQLRTKYKEAITSGDKDAIAQAKTELNAKVTERNIQRQILDRRTAETNAIQSRIESRQAKIETLKKAETPDAAKIAELESEINALKAEVEFATPRSNGVSIDRVKNDLKVWEEYLAEQEAAGANQASIDATKALIQNDKYILNGTKGNAVTQGINEVARSAVQDPAARWLTIENVGTKEHYPEYDYQVAPQPFNYYQYPQNQIIF